MNQNRNGSGWQKPFTLVENLESSVKSLTSTNGILNSTLNSLRSVTKEFTRQCQLTKFNREYELVTEKDIERARKDVSNEILPEIDQLFSEVDLKLTALVTEEKELSTKLEEQNQYMEDLESTLTKLQTNIPQDTNSGNNHKRKRSLDARTKHELENKRTRIKQLTTLKHTQENKNLEMTREVKELEREILDMEQQLETDAADTNQNKSDKQNDTRQLEEELAKLKEISFNKQNEYEKRLEQQKETPKSLETTAADSTQFTTSEYIELYTNVLDLIDKALPQVENQEFIASATAVNNCIISSKRYSQAIKKEKSKYPVITNAKTDQLKKLFRAIYPYGKTIGSLMELLLANPEKQLTIQELFKQFPPEKEKRHNVQKAVYILLQAAIIDLSETKITIKL